MAPKQWLQLATIFVCCLISASHQINWHEQWLDEAEVAAQLTPVHYRIRLDISEAREHYKGHVNIYLVAKTEAASVKQIVLHADASIYISVVRLLFGTASDGAYEVALKRCLRDGRHNLIGVELAQELRVGEGQTIVLEFFFQRPMLELSQERGLYWRDVSVSGGGRNLYALLDLTGARAPRQVLPCFDVDELRTGLELSIQHDRGRKAISINEPENLRPIELTEFKIDSPRKISLRSIAAVIGHFKSTGQPGKVMIHVLDDGNKTNGSAVRATIQSALALANALNSYLRLPLPQTLNIVVLPDLACGSASHNHDASRGDGDGGGRAGECELENNNERVIHGRAILIGTRESLLVTNSSDERQIVWRTYNLAHALARQYLSASFGYSTPGGSANWYAESCAAYLTVLVVQGTFKNLIAGMFIDFEAHSAALDVNARHPTLKLSAQTPNQLDNDDGCRQVSIARSHFIKSAALWHELARNFLKFKDESVFTLLLQACINELYSSIADTPIEQVSVALSNSGMFDSAVIQQVVRVLSVRSSAASYDCIFVDRFGGAASSSSSSSSAGTSNQQSIKFTFKPVEEVIEGWWWPSRDDEAGGKRTLRDGAGGEARKKARSSYTSFLRSNDKSSESGSHHDSGSGSDSDEPSFKAEQQQHYDEDGAQVRRQFFARLSLAAVDLVSKQAQTFDVVCDSEGENVAEEDACVFALPENVSFDTHLVYVKMDVNLPKFARLAYSDSLLGALARHYKLLRDPDLMHLIENLHGLARLNSAAVEQLALFARAVVPNPITILIGDSFLRVRESLNKHELKACSAAETSGGEQTNGEACRLLRRLLDRLVQRTYASGVIDKIQNNPSAAFKRAEARLLEHAVEMGGTKVMDDMKKRFVERGLYMPANLSGAFYRALVEAGNNNNIIEIMMAQKYSLLLSDDCDEKQRLLTALAHTKKSELANSVVRPLIEASDRETQRRLSKIIERP